MGANVRTSAEQYSIVEKSTRTVRFGSTRWAMLKSAIFTSCDFDVVNRTFSGCRHEHDQQQRRDFTGMRGSALPQLPTPHVLTPLSTKFCRLKRIRLSLSTAVVDNARGIKQKYNSIFAPQRVPSGSATMFFSIGRSDLPHCRDDIYAGHWNQESQRQKEAVVSICLQKWVFLILSPPSSLFHSPSLLFTYLLFLGVL